MGQIASLWLVGLLAMGGLVAAGSAEAQAPVAGGALT